MQDHYYDFTYVRIENPLGQLGLPGGEMVGLADATEYRNYLGRMRDIPRFFDEQIAKEAKKAFDKQGLKIELGVKVDEVRNQGEQGGEGQVAVPVQRARRGEVIAELVDVAHPQGAAEDVRRERHRHCVPSSLALASGLRPAGPLRRYARPRTWHAAARSPDFAQFRGRRSLYRRTT